MRSHSGRPSTAVDHVPTHAKPQRGFSFIELLVTVVLAGIVFAAMVPVFAGALKKTTGDNLRVTAVNIAQDRIEKIRQLPYADIVAVSATPTALPNLYNTAFPTTAPGIFAPTYKPFGSNKTYYIDYSVSTYPTYKDVQVSVRWQGSAPNYLTQMDTIVMDPSAMSVQSTSNPYPQPSSGYSLTVAFKDARQLDSPYLKVTYVQAGVTKTATPSPAPLVKPTSKTATITYYGLPGGANIPYNVTCYSQYITASAPMFHLLTNGYMKFDTHPGGS
jgi:prepilin-type N-terminal cleavage/methylation domain-containing protein